VLEFAKLLVVEKRQFKALEMGGAAIEYPSFETMQKACFAADHASL
jgi:hypothetical protein